MHIITIVKQVPEAEKVAVNPETGTLIREGVDSILNPFCEYALDTAVRLKNSYPELNIKITALTMGPPQAKNVLLKCLELGADSAVLLSDRKFAGADVWATALTLKSGIVKIDPNFDLILAGKQAIDGDTAQVPAEIAELLGIPQVYYGVDISINKKKIMVKRETEKGHQIVEMSAPALITISKGPWNIRRLPSIKDILDSRKKSLYTLCAKDLDIDEDTVGLSGSYTQVHRVFAPPQKKSAIILKNDDSKKTVESIISFLKEKSLIEIERCD